MARRRQRGRDVHGILLLDKPAGITSNAALQKVKRLFNANKAGHTGSLDPLATGVLPICLGEATKLSAYLLDADKRYQVVIQLGAKTTTGDAEGEVLEERAVPAFDEAGLESILARFRGDIEQTPPMYSALKRDGQPLYKLARQGIEVEREARAVSIYELVLLSFTPTTMTLDVRCSKGTYIRSLAEDIGEVFGCGGHVVALRRSVAASYGLGQSCTLPQLEAAAAESMAALDALLLPMSSAVADWPRVSLTADMAFYIQRGQAVQVSKAPLDGVVALYAGEAGFIGIGHILDDGRVAPKRLFVCKKPK
ncbi:MAG TPA: tRNA pseudouridine(55) synthase TruB [Candidatus Tenderia sp.]|nr:tRNA pseudouridine(55) synthase TruB [Candidatus Tenderia sp.]